MREWIGRPAALLTFLVLFMCAVSMPAQAQKSSKAGAVTRAPGYLGAQLLPLTEERASDLGIAGTRGVVLVWPMAGHAALAAGAQAGDIVLAVDGKRVAAAEDLVAAVSAKGVGGRITLDILRGGARKSLAVTLGARPQEPRLPADLPALLEEREKVYARSWDEKALLAAERAQQRLEAVLGADHLLVAVGQMQRGQIRFGVGQYDAAEKDLKTAREALERQVGPQHPKVSDATLTLGRVHQRQQRLAEAEAELMRALKIRETNAGRSHADVADPLYYLAVLYEDADRHEDAENAARRALGIQERSFKPDDERLASTLNVLGNALKGQRRARESEAAHRRALAIVESAQNPDLYAVSALLNNLGNGVMAQGRLDEAQPLLERALALREKILGPDADLVAQTLSNLGIVIKNRGQPKEALPYVLRSVAIREKTANGVGSDLISSLNNLGIVYLELNRLSEAEQSFRRILSIVSDGRGADARDAATAWQNLAEVLESQARYEEAAAAFTRALDLREHLFGRESADVADSVSSLGTLHMKEGRYAEAEAHIRRALELREKVSGINHPDVAKSLNDLAVLFNRQLRHAETVPLLKRAVDILEPAIGRDHPTTIGSLLNLAGVYKEMKQYDKARPLMQRAFEAYSRAFGPESYNAAVALDSLANLDSDLERFTDAEPNYRKALAIKERELGPDHPSVSLSVHNLAVLYRRLGRYEEALLYGERRLASLERVFGKDHPEVAQSLWFLGHARGLAGDWAGSYADFARASEYWIKRGDARDIAVATHSFHGHVRSAMNVAAREPARADVAARDAFAMMQWASRSTAGDALTSMAARAAAATGAVASLARERQDIADKITRADKTLIAMLAVPVGDRAGDRGGGRLAAARAELATLTARAEAIDERLRHEFPSYAALSRPEPLDIAAVQASLLPNEALVAFSFVVEEGYVFLVTPTMVRAVIVPVSYKSLYDRVMSLMCGLNAAVHRRFAEDCRNDLGVAPERDANGNLRNDTIPFDTKRAHALYKDLLGAFENDIKGRSLLVVSTGTPLAGLPFGALVTQPPAVPVPTDPDGYRNVSWLGLEQPITVLPSVASLKALRAVARSGQARAPYLAVANPLLDGSSRTKPVIEAAALARS